MIFQKDFCPSVFYVDFSLPLTTGRFSLLFGVEGKGGMFEQLSVGAK